MSHFTMLVVGENAEEQLAPFKEGIDDDNKVNLIFEECETEYIKKFKTEQDDEWYTRNNPMVTQTQFDSVKNSKKGERVALRIENGFCLMVGAKSALEMWVEPKKKGGKRIRKIIYVNVHDSQMIRRKPDDNGVYYYVTLEKIDSPKKISFKDKYGTFENFMKEYYGYDKRDEKSGKYGNWSNSNSKWNWYALGGNWNGFFILKDNARGDLGRPGLMKLAAPPKTADRAKIKDIDFKAMINEAKQEAEEQFDKLTRLLGVTELPKIIPWSEFIDDNGKYKKWTIEKKRDVYQDQPIKKKIKELSQSESISKEDQSFLAWLDYEDYMVGREEYVCIQKLQAYSTFGIVKDGKWYERGEMGWWDTISNEKEAKKWYIEFNKIIEELDPETTVSVYDCHI